MPAQLLVQRAGDVLHLVISYPEKRNALTPEMLRRLIDLCAEESTAPAPPRAALLTGEGDIFSAGFDLTALDTRGDPAAPPDDLVARAAQAIEDSSFPWVAALTGSVFGAGFELACACDLRVGVEGSRYSLPPAKFGIVYAPRGLARFAASLGQPAARELLLTGIPLGADRAFALGFLQRLAPSPAEARAEAESLANTLSQNAPLAIQGMRRAFHSLALAGLSPALLAAIEADRAAAFSSEDVQEGLRAFFEKRPPVFRGR